MHKKSTLTVLLVLALLSVKAQTTFGIKAGVNLNQYSSAFDSDQSNHVGAHVTGFVDVPLSTYLSIQPGLSWQQKGAKYPNSYSELRVNTVFTRTVNSIELPLNVIGHLPVEGAGDIFFGLGPYVGYNLNGSEWTRVITGFGRQSWDLQVNDEFDADNRNLHTWEAGANFLTGFQMENGILFNVQYGWGMSQLIPEDDDTISNRSWSFSVGYRF